MGDGKVDEQCIFCQIARGDFETEFVAESPAAVAFRDLHPQAPNHVLVIPRRHIRSLDELGNDDYQLIGDLMLMAAEVARREGIAETGYRVLTNTGADGGQSVFHLHLHVIGGRPLGIGIA